MPSFDNVVLTNAQVMDVVAGELVDGQSVRVADGLIQEIGAKVSTGDAHLVDVRGSVVMPGLIDAHVHVMASDLKLSNLARASSTLLVAKSVPILRDMLRRGFTTVRDAGGADWGLAQAVRTGYFEGPRLFISGRGIAQTGGQGDFRELEDTALPDYHAHALGAMARVADGVEAVRAAVREELRRGADQIKIFGGGGVAGGIPLTYSHFTEAEIATACEEAAAVGTYVMAHAYAPQSILRAVEAGARTIEHGNYITKDVARQIKERAYLVPTLSSLDGRLRHADELGLSPAVRETITDAIEHGLAGIEACAAVGVPVGFGTDLEGIIHPYQHSEFSIRARVQEPADLIRSATVVNAEILNMTGRLGVIVEGAEADLLVIDGNPLADIEVLGRDDKRLAVMKQGAFVTSSLT